MRAPIAVGLLKNALVMSDAPHSVSGGVFFGCEISCVNERLGKFDWSACAVTSEPSARKS